MARTVAVDKLLQDLLPVVNGIHGGCDVCRNNWMEKANAVLEQDGVSWRYAFPVEQRTGARLLRSDNRPNVTFADIELVQIEPVDPVAEQSPAYAPARAAQAAGVHEVAGKPDTSK